MKAFVTGGSGHVGGNLVRELLSRGYEVDCLVRSDTRALDNLDVSYVNGDMLNPLLKINLPFSLSANIVLIFICLPIS